MKILIIGNGFDLAHGLPTKYTDFLESVQKFLEYHQNTMLHNSFGIFFADALKKYNLYDDFCSIQDNVWLAQLLNRRRKNEEIGDTWIDFEREIRVVISRLENAYLTGSYNFRLLFNDRPSYSVFKKKFSDTCTEQPLTADKYAIAVSEFLFNELMEFTRAFEIYCLCIINGHVNDYIEVPLNTHNDVDERITELHERYVANKLLQDTDFNCVLSFNYTNTFKALYDRNNSTIFCYIHGKAQDEKGKTNMIFGIDETLQKGDDSKQFIFAKFKKYFQRITNETGSEYKDWIHNAVNSPYRKIGLWPEVHIIGHSLDSTDHEILKEFFDADTDKNKFKITIYYYDEPSKIKLIEKTIEMIGKDELIRRVHGKNKNIYFMNQYDKEFRIIKRPNEVENPPCNGFCGIFTSFMCNSCKNNK